MKVGVTGSTGQLGHEIISALKKSGIPVIPLPRAVLDLGLSHSLHKILDSFELTCVVNCAAYTSVDGAEYNRELAMQVNAIFPGELSKYCKERNIALLHISTDSVFSSETPIYFQTMSPTNPLNVYAKSKAAGEQAVIEAELESFRIIRTAWLYGKHGHKFVQAILEKASVGKSFEVVNDQFGQPTSASSLAKFIEFMLTNEREKGIYHFASSNHTSRADFAKEILTLRGLDPSLVIAVPTRSNPNFALRPAFSLLDTSSKSTSNYPYVRGWEEELNSFLVG